MRCVKQGIVTHRRQRPQAEGRAQEVAVDDAAAHLAQHKVIVELPDLQGGEDVAVIEQAELIEDGFIREKPGAVQRS